MSGCDAEDCTRRATQVGVARLPIESLELRLCDEHVEALRAGRVRGLSQRTGWRNDGARPQVSFSSE
jgi:hypothetical protein